MKWYGLQKYRSYLVGSIPAVSGNFDLAPVPTCGPDPLLDPGGDPVKKVCSNSTFF